MAEQPPSWSSKSNWGCTQTLVPIILQIMSLERREHFLTLKTKGDIFVQTWKNPSKKFQGTLIITHGLGQHSENYHHVATPLVQQGWVVYSWDLPGHGRSQGHRGYVDSFGDFHIGLKKVLNNVREQQPNTPPILMGHSLGGLICLSTIVHHCLEPLTGLILCCPALALSMPVPKIKEKASRWIYDFWPKLTLGTGVDYNKLSRDPQMVASYETDPLGHSKISAPLYLGMMEEMEIVKKKVGNIQIPLFLQLAGQDQIVDTEESLSFYEKIQGNKDLKVYPKSYHEIYNDINRNEVIYDLEEQLKKWKNSV